MRKKISEIAWKVKKYGTSITGIILFVILINAFYDLMKNL
jgi:hypothetical protein